MSAPKDDPIAAESLVSAAPPEGMVEVPVEPTEEMVAAGANAVADSSLIDAPRLTPKQWHGFTRRVYKAMIAARPVAAPLRDALRQIKAHVCGDKIPNWTDSITTTRSRMYIADLCDRALSAAPNNAPQQGDFAAARKGGPDRASGDRGTQWISVNERLPVHNDVVIVAGGIALWRQPSSEWPEGQFFTLTGVPWPGKPIQWEVTHWQPLPKPPVDAAMGSPTK